MDQKIIVGLDVGRSSAVACVMRERPTDLANFVKQYRPITITIGQAGLETLIQLGDIFALEPTGKDHRWLKRELERAGKLVLVCSGLRIRNHAREAGILSKGDKEDAAVIGSYCWHHLDCGNMNAFLGDNDEALRDTRTELLSAQRYRTKLINQLRARLADEQPELSKFRIADRKWAGPSVEVWNKLLKDQALSWLAQEDIKQILYWDSREQALEIQAEQMMMSDNLKRHKPVWENWQLSMKQVIPILAAVHPVEQFLNGDLSRIVDHIYTASGHRVKCDRSLRGMHRALGYGRVKIQSGDTWRWRRSGDGSTIAALYMWLEMAVIRRSANRHRLSKMFEQPENFKSLSKKKQAEWVKSHDFRSYCLMVEPRCETVKPLPRDKQRIGFMPWKDAELVTKVCDYSLTTPPVAVMQLYYEWAFFESNKHDRILKTLPVMIKLLAKDLIESVR